MENQDLNKEFGTSLPYTKDRVKDIAKRRGVTDVKTLGMSSLRNPASDYGVSKIWKAAKEDLMKLGGTLADIMSVAKKYYSSYLDYTPQELSAARQVWAKADAELRQLLDADEDTLYNIAFKYFEDDLSWCETDEDRRDAINTLLDDESLDEKLKETICEQTCTLAGHSYPVFSTEEAKNTDVEDLLNDLEGRLRQRSSVDEHIISDVMGESLLSTDGVDKLCQKLKEKICSTQYISNRTKYTLFTKGEAQTKSIDELCQMLDARLDKMGALLDEDFRDRNTFQDAQTNHTYEELFKALAPFLDAKLGEKMTKKKKPIFQVTYDEVSEALVCVHQETGRKILIVVPNVDYEEEVGPLDTLVCDIHVAGLGLPDSHPLYQDITQMKEVLSYNLTIRGRGYSPRKDGEYDIVGVKASDLPNIIFRAIEDWQAASTACKLDTDAWNEANETMGGENLDDLEFEVNRNTYFNKLANTKDPSALTSTYYKTMMDDLKNRTDRIAPKLDKKGKVTDEDVSNAFNKLQIALGGITADGDIFTEDELDELDGLDDDDLEVVPHDDKS